MSSSVSKALELPEILHTIARWIPLFELELPLPSFSCLIDPDQDDFYYKPDNFLSCTLVSRLWNTIFTPYLYHFYLDYHTMNDIETYPDCLQAFQKHSHHFRRYCSLHKSRMDNVFPFKIEAPPSNLVSLRLCSAPHPVTNLLLCNQNLRQLGWSEQWPPREMDQVYQDALANLPNLEELDLGMWIVSSQLMYRVLNGCASKLRKLRLENVKGYDEGFFLFKDGSQRSESNESTANKDDKSEGPKWVLPHLTFLRLQLSWLDSEAVVLLPQICPALESIHLAVDMEKHSIPQLVTALRENCPNLNTIYYQEGYSIAYEYGFFPTPEVYASLFKDSFSSPRLQCATMGLPTGLDGFMMKALLFHSTTLVTLGLNGGVSIVQAGRIIHATLEMNQVVILLAQCKNLRHLRLFDVNCSTESMEELLTTPWGCHGLEQLVIEGYGPPDPSSDLPAAVLKFTTKRKRIRQNAWPRRFRHHEYRDEGQGWFLKPGLESDAFYEALVDGDWKRRLFEHMYTASGIRNVKNVRLKDTEFFAQEQGFDDPKEEMYEMTVEEGLVVDYRKME